MIKFISIEPEQLKHELSQLQAEVRTVVISGSEPRPELFEQYTEVLKANIHLDTGAVSSRCHSLHNSLDHHTP